MVTYNPKDWWKLIFAFHKSDTFRQMLPGIIGIALFTGTVAYLENEVFHATFKNTTIVHSLVGLVLSLFLVFRTNTAYDRWWEGRKAWGSLVNNSRNLALKLSVLPLSTQEKEMFSCLITNYALATRDHLRDMYHPDTLRTSGIYDTEWYRYSNHLPNRVAKALHYEINQLLVRKKMTAEQLLYMNEELRSFTDTVGICERIKKTPIPYSYSLYLKKIIFIYVFTMPIGFAREFGYWSMPIVSIVFYAFGSIELLAEEIEDPFGSDANDLPTDQISENIEKNVLEILMTE